LGRSAEYERCGWWNVKDEIIEKLATHLQGDLNTEKDVLYLLIEVRKLMDRDSVSRVQFPSLRLYANWVVHVALGKDVAADVVERVNRMYPRLVKGRLTKKDKAFLNMMFHPKSFRGQLERYLQRNGLPRFSEKRWNSF
jgi:hypothetical protein